MGIMAEILSEEFDAEKIKGPFLEFPTKSQPDSSERKKFWEDLENSIMAAHRQKNLIMK
jgi:hypothetical protein